MLPMMFAYGQVTVEDDVAYGGCFRNKLLIINTVFLHAQRINLVTAPARRAKKQYSPVWISCSALYLFRVSNTIWIPLTRPHLPPCALPPSNSFREGIEAKNATEATGAIEPTTTENEIHTAKATEMGGPNKQMTPI